MARLSACALTAILLGITLAACQRSLGRQVLMGERDEAVILVHGLLRSSDSMADLAIHLRQRGYTVVLVDYPSSTAPVEQLAAEHLAPAIAMSRSLGAQRIHIVGHSLGGILARQHLAEHSMPDLGHVIMLGSPNQGSEVVDAIGSWKLFKLLHGPVGDQLGTGPDSALNTLPAATWSCGVVAGHRSINWINSSTMLPGPDDGKVTVARASFEGVADSVVLPVSHPFLMRDRRTWYQIDHFLTHGRFDHERAPTIDGFLAKRNDQR